jgi:hypothetical protein
MLGCRTRKRVLQLLFPEQERRRQAKNPSESFLQSSGTARDSTMSARSTAKALSGEAAKSSPAG